MKKISDFIIEHLEYSTYPIIEKLKIGKSMKQTFDMDALSAKYDLRGLRTQCKRHDGYECISIDYRYPEPLDLYIFTLNIKKFDSALNDKWKICSCENYTFGRSPIISWGDNANELYLTIRRNSDNACRADATFKLNFIKIRYFKTDDNLENMLAELLDTVLNLYYELAKQ